MPEPTNTGARIYLIPIAGPPLEPLQIVSREGGVTIGRHAQCDLPLPIEAEMVSRFHLRFDRVGNEWRLTDLNSRWGTFLNGVRMAASQAMPVAEGDLVRINPWTFSVSNVLVRRGLEAAPDDHTTMVHTMLSEPGTRPREDIVGLLLEGAAAIHGAQTEQELAERLMDVAIRGTGLTNAVLLRPLDARGRIEPIAMHAKADAEGNFRFSRSLIAAAAEGRVARIGGGGAADVSQSIVEMRITAALCVPLMLGESPAALLYLDARGPFPATVRDDATEFCVALGRIASLALANLKRIDIERRQVAMESELQAAAAAQKWVMPKRLSRVGPFVCVGESRAGQYVGGDFFDVIDLGQGRLGLALGDVSGKGVSASVLMTATQGFLHAALSHDADPGRAVTAVNNFVGPRRPENRFVTMWVGVFDSVQGTLRYVDAGHGYALQQSADGSFVPLNAGGGPPVGIAPEDYEYTAETAILPRGAKVVVVSDGIVEQPAGNPDEDGRRPQFDVDGVQAALSAAPKGSDEIQALFDAVVQHAGSDRLADDATAVVVRR